MVRDVSRLWSRDADHYYRITAALSARGAHGTTWRVMASITIAFGLLAMAWAFGLLAIDDWWHQGIALAVGICCLAVATQWMRRRWPSRAVSRACALAASLCLAAYSALATDPVLGLLSCTPFVVMTIYVAMFHSLGLLLVTWAIAGAAVTILVVRLWTINPSVAISSGINVLLVNLFAAFTCRVILQLVRTDVPNEHMEPVTGLLTQDGFRQHIATLLGARSRQDDRFLVLLVIGVDHFDTLRSQRGASYANEVRINVAQLLRETVRREALIGYPGNAEFLVADLFTTNDPTPLSMRLRLAISEAPVDATASVGVVITPLGPLTRLPPDDVLDELVAVATTAMDEARAAGGNQTRHAINPALTVLNQSTEPGHNETSPGDADRWP